MLPIETERLRLRRLNHRDATRLAEYRSEPSVARYQSWTDMTVQEAEHFIRTLPDAPFAHVDEWFQIGIADKATDELIGDIGVCRRSPGDTVEIGYTLAPAVQGLGLATEACGAVIDLALRHVGITTVVAVIDSRNTSAILLAKRLGMVLAHTETAEFKGHSCLEHHFMLQR